MKARNKLMDQIKCPHEKLNNILNIIRGVVKGLFGFYFIFFNFFYNIWACLVMSIFTELQKDLWIRSVGVHTWYERVFLGTGDLLGSFVQKTRKISRSYLLKVLIEMAGISWIDEEACLPMFGNTFKCVIQEDRFDLRV